MRRPGLTLAAISAVPILVIAGSLTLVGQARQTSGTSQSPAYLQWALPAADRAYGDIDGRHLHEYVVEQAAIARRYRDQGHPQFWGRITGTSSDVEDAQWLLDNLNKIGLTDTHIQSLDIPPQWIANSWDVSIASAGKTVPLTSAQVAYRTPSTAGLDVEAVYVGLGSEADFAGRDVRGKAVFAFATWKPGPSVAQAGVLKRAQERGAAALFSVEGLPGNMKLQSYDLRTSVPTFSLGTKDGEVVRAMIAQAPPGAAPHVKIRIDAGPSPSAVKTGLVWGTLKGTTDETIYIIAHRDGWFDAAGDNAAGVAVMLGLAEHFSKVPASQRRRTIVFIGTDGHHQIVPGGFGREWLVAHRDQFFAKTALMINCEHPSEVATHLEAGEPADTNTTVAMDWYAGGHARPALEEMAGNVFREFGVTIWSRPSAIPPGGDVGRFYWFLPGLVVQSNDFLYFHTDQDKPEYIPWTGLESAARAYAKIIDEVNGIDLKDLQRPPLPDPRPAGTPSGYL